MDNDPPAEVKYPGWNDKEIPEGAECQDTLGKVGNRFVRCGRQAYVIVAIDDDHPYYMCRQCGQYAVVYRGGKYLLRDDAVPGDGPARWP